MTSNASPPRDLREPILAALRQSTKPVTYKNLSALVKAKDLPLHEALDSAVRDGVAFRWPDYRRSQYFWHRSPEEQARDTILAVAAKQALSAAKLKQLVAGKLYGLPAKRLQNVLSALLEEKVLRAVPSFTINAKLLILHGDSEAYFTAARSFLDKKFRAAGLDPDAFFINHSSAHDKLASPAGDEGERILQAIQSLEPVRGVPVSTLRLRNKLPDLSKNKFDTAALQLRRKQDVYLSAHADPHNLSPQDKDLLIDGEDGTYYVAVAIR